MSFSAIFRRVPRLPGRRALLLAAVPLLLLAAWGAHLLWWRVHLKRFDVVRDDVLYRTGLPSQHGLHYLIEQRGVRTVLSLREDEARLERGLLDLGQPNGLPESKYVDALGARFLQWPMGPEKYWPWLSPAKFEQFFQLMDDPANQPVLVHCTGGRHRTGTFSALYRLEYDRWDPQRALDEMHTFQFGPSAVIQEHNLRTYLPRPYPDAATWKQLHAHWARYISDASLPDYHAMVAELRERRNDPNVRGALEAYVRQEQPFALELAQRLIDDPSDLLAGPAAEIAAQRLERKGLPPQQVSTAAALVADFGTPAAQRALLERLIAGSRAAEPTPHYEALVAGVTNRYTPNRLAYLRPLLDDRRQRCGERTAMFRYSDTAVMRLVSMTDAFGLSFLFPKVSNYDDCVDQARQWLDTHREEARLSALRDPWDGPVLATQTQREEAGRF